MYATAHGSRAILSQKSSWWVAFDPSPTTHSHRYGGQVTLVTAIFSFLNPYTRMGGTELVYNLFAECRDGSKNTHSGLCVLDPPTQAMPVIGAIFLAMLVKGALTIVTFGIKVPAGIFIPTLGGTYLPRP